MHRPMFAPACWGARRGAIVLSALGLCTGLAGCAGTGERLASMVTPYKVDVVQGNFISREQVQALQPGMGRQQVRDILGTPLVVSVFHADRWDYVFTLKRQGVEPQARKLVVFFNNDVLDRFEGDVMPSEAEFVSALDRRRTTKAVPTLEASEESLKKFAPQEGTAAKASAPVLPPPPTSYPPLESPAQ